MLRIGILSCILLLYSCSLNSTDYIQLLRDNKEQQSKLQEQINILNIRIKETDKTIIAHWKRMQKQLNNIQVKEAPITNE